jgi:hypothetical protein
MVAEHRDVATNRHLRPPFGRSDLPGAVKQARHTVADLPGLS